MKIKNCIKYVLGASLVSAISSGSLAQTTDKVINGYPANQGDYPWMAALIRAGTDAYDSQFCGGSLIAPRVVLTAAHCVDGLVNDPKSVDLILDRADLTDLSSGVRYTAEKIYTFYGYNAFKYDRDVALIYLNKEAHVDPVAMTDTPLEPGELVKTMGWGLTENQRYPEQLHQVEVPIVDNNTCNLPTSYDGAITGNMICAGFLGEGGKDACYGDSGGPLLVQRDDQWQLTGIVSWGKNCAEENYPGVYSRVSTHLSWINIFKESLPKYYLVNDFNGDGHQDAFYLRNDANQTNQILITGADNNFLTIDNPLGIIFPQEISTLLAGDYNADGSADLYAYNKESQFFRISTLKDGNPQISIGILPNH